MQLLTGCLLSLISLPPLSYHKEAQNLLPSPPSQHLLGELSVFFCLFVVFPADKSYFISPLAGEMPVLNLSPAPQRLWPHLVITVLGLGEAASLSWLPLMALVCSRSLGCYEGRWACFFFTSCPRKTAASWSSKW